MGLERQEFMKRVEPQQSWTCLVEASLGRELKGSMPATAIPPPANLSILCRVPSCATPCSEESTTDTEIDNKISCGSMQTNIRRVTAVSTLLWHYSMYLEESPVQSDTF